MTFEKIPAPEVRVTLTADEARVLRALCGSLLARDGVITTDIPSVHFSRIDHVAADVWRGLNAAGYLVPDEMSYDAHGQRRRAEAQAVTK